MGWRPIQEIVKNCHMHLRLTGHDGYPHTPIYHLLGGRRVLCNFPLQYAEFIPYIPSQNNWEQLKPMVIEHIRKNIKKPPEFKIDEVRKFYLTQGSPDNYKTTIYNIINNYKKETHEEETENKLCPANMEPSGVSERDAQEPQTADV